jgi:hypothetical protein
MDELRKRLREAGQQHRPDRARMLARIERGMAEDPQGIREHGPSVWPSASVPPWLRVIGATTAASGVLFVGGLGVGAAVRDEDSQQTVASSPTPDPSLPPATARPIEPGPDGASAPPSGSSSATPSGAPEPSGAQGGRGDTGGGDLRSGDYLRAQGSIDPHSNYFWAQSNIAFRTERPLNSLTIELRIAQTGGVDSTGAWRSLPETDFDLSVNEKDDGALVYRWTLKEGRTVPAGEYVFAGQYTHAPGDRDTDDDSYLIEAESSGEPVDWRGDFTSTSD